MPKKFDKGITSKKSKSKSDDVKKEAAKEECTKKRARTVNS